MRKGSEHINRQSYPRVKRQVVIRETLLGSYLLSGDCILEVGESAKEIIRQCDGLHTIQEIVEWTAKKNGEVLETTYRELENLLNVLLEEGVIIYRNFPDPISPIYNYDRPLSVIWEITYACNQKCKYCIVKAGTSCLHELSHEEIDKVLDELIELEVGLINITGGEPLLKKDTVLRIGRKASEHGIELELLTNGMLATPSVAQEVYEAGIRHAQVSLDCAKPEVHDKLRGVKGAWEKAVKGIQNFRNAGINVMAAAVINSENIEYFEETREFLEKTADTLKISPVLPMGRGKNNSCLLTPEMYLRLLELKKATGNGNQLADFIFPRERCSIGTAPVIAPNGDVYPCMLTKYEELKLGNVRKTSIRSIYKESKLLHELFNWNVDKIQKCRHCWNRYYCGGGCRGATFAYHGTIYENDLYQCVARRKFAQELLKRGHPVTRKALKELISLARNGPGRNNNG